MTYREFLRTEFDKLGIDHKKGLEKLIYLIKQGDPDELELINTLQAIHRTGGF